LSEPRLLRFTPGRRRQAWSRNVVAIGLSSGFLEPLESTSIHMIQSGIERLLKHFPDRRFSSANTAAYNAGVSQEMERIRDFLILHYKATRRTDSAFWNHVRTMDIPDSLALRMEIFRERGQLIHAPDELFVDTSWLSVLIGQGVTPQGYDPLVESTDIAVLRQGFAQMKAHLADLTAAMPTHYDYLKRRGCLAETAGLIKGAAERAMVHRDGEAEVAAAEIGMTDISFAR
jgi:tryptophan halogenase